MTSALIQRGHLRTDPHELRRDLQEGGTPDLGRRRGIIGLSLLGMASIAAVSLLQTGVVKHLPDPPLGGFNSDKVNSSETAYQFGVPDGAVALASLAANIPIAAFGGADRARRQPWVPLVAAGKAAVEAVAAGWYFYQMPAKERACCGYCIMGALASFGILALTLPEAHRALDALRSPSAPVGRRPAPEAAP
jgi:uncharacterized membrane protein